jgi:hypothetical protein
LVIPSSDNAKSLTIPNPRRDISQADKRASVGSAALRLCGAVVLVTDPAAQLGNLPRPCHAPQSRNRRPHQHVSADRYAYGHGGLDPAKKQQMWRGVDSTVFHAIIGAAQFWIVVSGLDYFGLRERGRRPLHVNRGIGGWQHIDSAD